MSRSLALQYRLATVEVALGWLEAPWLALQGNYAEAYALIAHTAQTMNRTSMNQQSEALAGTAMTIQIIQGQLDEAAVEQFSMVASSSEIPMSANVLVVLLRAGRLAEVRERYAAQGLTLGPETWFSLISDSLAAEVAAEVGDRGAGDAGLSPARTVRRDGRRPRRPARRSGRSTGFSPSRPPLPVRTPSRQHMPMTPSGCAAPGGSSRPSAGSATSARRFGF